MGIHGIVRMVLLGLGIVCAALAGAQETAAPEQAAPAASPTEAPAVADPAAAGPDEQILLNPEQSPEERRDQYWYFIIGPANVYPKLALSENEINRDINGLFGKILPRWEEPTTFKDWRENGMLWDVHVGIGRSLSDKWALFMTAGAIAGKVKTVNTYFPLFIPTEINVFFERRVFFASAGVDYHPWGKADYADAVDGNWFTRRVKAAKPYVELGWGYVNLRTVGQVRLNVPIFDDIAKIRHEKYYDLFYVSPRIGLDIPLNENDTLGLMAGYLFFTRFPDEFSTPSFYFLYKHRF